MGKINVDEIKNEIVRYGKANPMALQPAILSREIMLNRYAKPLGKVKGKWTIPYILFGNVVQAFSDKWTPYGEVQFAKKVAKNFHQKVNFPINPYDVYGSWVEDLYEEEKKPADMPISKYIVDMVRKQIISDLDTLSISGKFDSAQVGTTTPEYGKSMDGLNKVVDEMVSDTENPVFFIPVDASLANSPVDRVTAYEKNLPTKGNISNIFISLEEFYEYVEQRETPSDKYIDFNDPQRGKTKFGRNIVGVPGLKKGRIVSFYDGNLFRLYDRKDNPATIDDVQVQDYIIKLFSQWHLGYDFAINQYCFVETADAAKNRGLNNTEQNKLFYPNQYGLN
ncbi:hypothetical protein [Tenacibaculum maritimum]|uniref:hypothetical protein n=1 Tax=Tenacibaculum maritimum TaxID=107401 RepID=UPI0012E5CC30|nr:hypothetical protein [Tenacibaculum maritimum]CAA0157410.1 conserved hypothetical protein [Tenacibaculum maritimum]CAA0170593.1 conserved hypothetical protein [Tenacibaculum maritimum]CAA0239588.1 conserved hypothetical protein [Tenacibaculum maritimum]